MISTDELKKKAAEKAVEQVKSGMVLGLGTGSNAGYATIKIGQLWQAGTLTDIVGIPTSEGTARLARQYDIPLASLDDYPDIDLVIDGADEVDPNLNMIKGLGGALLREKLIEIHTKYLLIVIDDRKLVQKLGERSPLPVEVACFGRKTQARWLESLGSRPVLRGGEADPYLTDNGNYILDCHFPTGIDNPTELGGILQSRPGVIEHGLFMQMADKVIVGSYVDGVYSLER